MTGGLPLVKVGSARTMQESQKSLQNASLDELRAAGVRVTVAQGCWGIEQSQTQPVVRSRTDVSTGKFYGKDARANWDPKYRKKKKSVRHRRKLAKMNADVRKRRRSAQATDRQGKKAGWSNPRAVPGTRSLVDVILTPYRGPYRPFD